MARFTLLREAENDLIEIWRFIAEDDQEAATRVLHSLDEVPPARPNQQAGA